MSNTSKTDFTYNNRNYFLAQLDEPFTDRTFSVIAIFEDRPDEDTNLVYVNYFYFGNETADELIEIAKQYIDSKS